jgi:NTP pyrophosphatase (non-canonical NTP hydrolase)
MIVLEEAGDLLWYVAILLHSHGVQIIEHAPALTDSVLQPLIFIAEGLDWLTDEVFDLWNRARGGYLVGDFTHLNMQRDPAARVLYRLACVLGLHGFSLLEAAQANVAKLKERYPDGFSSQRSRERGS